MHQELPSTPFTSSPLNFLDINKLESSPRNAVKLKKVHFRTPEVSWSTPPATPTKISTAPTSVLKTIPSSPVATYTSYPSPPRSNPPSPTAARTDSNSASSPSDAASLTAKRKSQEAHLIKQICSTKRELSELQARRTALVAELSTKDSKIEQLESRSMGTSSELVGADELITSLETEIGELRLDVERVNKSADGLREENEALRAELERLRKGEERRVEALENGQRSWADKNGGLSARIAFYKWRNVVLEAKQAKVDDTTWFGMEEEAKMMMMEVSIQTDTISTAVGTTQTALPAPRPVTVETGTCTEAEPRLPPPPAPPAAAPPAPQPHRPQLRPQVYSLISLSLALPSLSLALWSAGILASTPPGANTLLGQFTGPTSDSVLKWVIFAAFRLFVSFWPYYIFLGVMYQFLPVVLPYVVDAVVRTQVFVAGLLGANHQLVGDIRGARIAEDGAGQKKVPLLLGVVVGAYVLGRAAGLQKHGEWKTKDVSSGIHHPPAPLPLAMPEIEAWVATTGMPAPSSVSSSSPLSSSFASSLTGSRSTPAVYAQHPTSVPSPGLGYAACSFSPSQHLLLPLAANTNAGVCSAFAPAPAPAPEPTPASAPTPARMTSSPSGLKLAWILRELAGKQAAAKKEEVPVRNITSVRAQNTHSEGTWEEELGPVEWPEQAAGKGAWGVAGSRSRGERPRGMSRTQVITVAIVAWGFWYAVSRVGRAMG